MKKWLADIWNDYKKQIIWGVAVSVVSGVGTLSFYIAKGLYDAPYREERMQEALTKSINSLQLTLSKQLDEQSKQLESNGKDIQKIKQTILTLVFNSPAKQEDKERMIRELAVVIDPRVAPGATDFARGKYGAAFSSWFTLYKQGNLDAGVAILSGRRILESKVETGTATSEERKALVQTLQTMKAMKFDG
ncbi:MAG: hypothetical protein ACRDGM_16035 [bacterium]